MRTHKVLFLLALVMLLTLSISAVSAQDPVVITWWHIQTLEDQAAVWQDAADAYMEMNPGVEIEITVLENEAFKGQLVTVMQAGDPPDLFQSWGGGPLWAFADAGLLRDIAPEINANDGEWRDTIASEGTLGLWGRGEEQYGVPWTFGPVGIWYNKALMEQAGLDPEAPFTTWDEFIAAIEALQAEGIIPIAIGEGEKWPGMFWFAYLALRIGGGEAYAAANDRSGAFTDEAFVEAFEKIVELVDMGAFQDDFLAYGYADAAGMVGRGEAAMQLMGTWDPGVQMGNCGEDCEGLGEDLGWTTFPVIEGGAGNPGDMFGGGDGFAVGANAEDEAVAFLRYLTSYEVVETAFWTVPTVVGAEDILEAREFPSSVYGPLWVEAMGEAPVMIGFLDQFYSPGLGEAINDGVETVFAGAATPEEAAEAIEDMAMFELE